MRAGRSNALFRNALVAVLLATTVAVSAGAVPAGAQDVSATTAPSSTAPSATAADPSQPTLEAPGVYVDELPAAGVVAVPPTGIPLVVGSGTSSSSSQSSQGPVEVTSLEEFTSLVQQPSTLLANGIVAFFELGGTTAYVQLTQDESAASLAAGLDAVSIRPGSFDLVAVPAIAQLDVAGHQRVAIAANQLATRSDAVVLLDIPDEIAATKDPATVVPWAAGLDAALPASDQVMVISAGLLGQDSQLVPGSLAIAALAAADDAEHGFGASGVGGLTQPLTDYDAVWPVTNEQVDVLAAGAVNSFRDVVGYGSLLWGNLMLSASEPDPGRHLYLTPRRVMNQIQLVMALVGQSVVFDDNEPATWDAVTEQLSAYLTDLWAAGALIGPTAEAAFSVSVGLDTTMTAQDILDGFMIVAVDAAVMHPAEFVTLTSRQEMAAD
jgi:hypothetical protein